MKSILLIGDLNSTLGNIYQALAAEYQVQMAQTEFAEVEGKVKIVKPDLALISMYGVSDLDRQILEYFKETEGKIPVLFVGSFEECREYLSAYQGSSFRFLERPVTQKELLGKCEEMLNLAEGKQQEGNNAVLQEKKRILVVDDSGVFLRAMKALLEPKYEILLAKSGEKGLETAAGENPDLILLDYEMPGWDGKRTLEELRENEKTAEIPVIFLTGVNDKNHILEILKMQPQGYVLKPVEGDDLEKKIGDVI